MVDVRCVKCFIYVECFRCVLGVLYVLDASFSEVRGRCNGYLGRKSMKTLRTQGAILWVAGVRKFTFSTPGWWVVSSG